ncbi:hypothetical protein TH24_17065 [Thalassospira xiamenensis]|nr:hypothetical protein TH24_17065 [Thalassospira xiamenensis]
MWVIAACRVCSDPSLHTVGDAIRHIEAIGLAEIGATLRLISTLSLALGAIVMSASLIIPSIASFLSWTLKSVLFKDKRV